MSRCSKAVLNYEVSVIPLLPPPQPSPPRSLRIRDRDPCNFRQKGAKVNGKQSGSAANVEQDSPPLMPICSRDFLEKLWRIRLPVAGIEFNVDAKRPIRSSFGRWPLDFNKCQM